MATAHTYTKILTAAVGAIIATIADLPTPRTCGSCVGFNPQPDPPGDPDPDSKVGLGGPDTKVGVDSPGRAPSPSLNPGDTVGIIIDY